MAEDHLEEQEAYLAVGDNMNTLLGFIVPFIVIFLGYAIFYGEIFSFIPLAIWNCLPFYLLCKFGFSSESRSSSVLQYIPFSLTYMALFSFIVVSIVVPDAFAMIALVIMPLYLSVLIIPFYWITKMLVSFVLGIGWTASKVDQFFKENPSQEKAAKKSSSQNKCSVTNKVKTATPVVLLLFSLAGIWVYFNIIRMSDIYDAITQDDIQTVKKMVEDDFDLNSINPSYGTVLHWAILNDNYVLVEYFLEAGANPEIVYDKDTSLMFALKYGNYEIAKLLLESGANSDLTDMQMEYIFESNYLNEEEKQKMRKLLMAYKKDG
jgi:hypothetical protein